MQKKLIAQLVVLFALTQIVGIYVALTLIPQDVHTSIITDNPDDITNAFGLIAYILVATAILLLGIKFMNPSWILKILETLAVFAASVIVFQAFVGELALIVGAGIVIARWKWRTQLLFKNMVSVIASAGVGSILGLSLGIIPALLVLVLMSVYDLIAVFKTKHMVTLAKAVIQENTAFTYSLPTKEHTYQLGTGDMVMPLMFAVSVLNARIVPGVNSIGHLISAPFVILVASLIGLIITLEIAERKKQPLPALPIQCALMILVWGLLNVLKI